MAQPTQSNTFTSGPILLPFIRFTLPILLSMFLQALYSAVDLIVISRYCGAAEIAAVAAGGNVMYMIQVVVTGLAMGVTVAIGRYIGEGNFEDAAKSMGSSICVFAAFGALLTAIMLIAAPFLIRAMDMPPEAYPFAVDYLMICSAGILFLVGYNLISCIFRGIGNAILPLVFVVIAAAINVVGDIILVTQYHMGVRGVAIATVCAQAVSVVLSILIIRAIKLPFQFSRKHIRFGGEKIREMFSIGTPLALSDLVTQFSFLAVNAIANGMGVLLSAGYGIAWKVVSFVLLIPISFMQSMSAFIAQNMGAQQPERAKKTLYYAWAVAVGIGFVVFYIVRFHSAALAAIFTPNQDVIAAAADYLRGFSIDCIQVGILFCYMGFYNGCCRTRFVFFQAFWDGWIMRVPVAYFMSQMAGAHLFHIALATPIATSSTIIVCTMYYLLIRKHIFNTPKSIPSP